MITSNKEMVENLIYDGVLKTDKIIEAFLEVDRINFVKFEYLEEAYANYPLPIWHSQTISQPATVWILLELLQPNEWDHILDIWSWSWWTTVLLWKIIKNKGKVIWIEIIPELVEFSKENLEKYDLQNTEIRLSWDNLWIPWEKFDKILVSASARELPKELLDQLKIWWNMVIPIKNSLFLIKKIKENKIEKKEYFWFSFVPLIYQW
ncbi:MAG: Protein-L-isoaspartate(D-aspartate) O-methyltransferase [uncultured bacterium (gcode 4)]|uniref:Protein-L-isoaspartate O-methyltransferase n=1 Tax=uncultured bacterium (gcode 4) TaxID=1234023 RepID=K2FVQ3_9BACT|nr:MAG: Protein-L-isoaspartate(D-aspartate) O-methyltransferase [uncultured bacterium (gcode 4)]